MIVGNTQTLTKEQWRPNDVFINEQLTILDKQANYKIKNHIELYDLPYILNQNVGTITRKTKGNTTHFTQKINNIVIVDSAL